MTTRESQLVEDTLREYQAEEISIGWVGEILGLHLMDVQHLLAERKIPLNISMEDVEADVATLRKLGYMR